MIVMEKYSCQFKGRHCGKENVKRQYGKIVYKREIKLFISNRLNLCKNVSSHNLVQSNVKIHPFALIQQLPSSSLDSTYNTTRSKISRAGNIIEDNKLLTAKYLADLHMLIDPGNRNCGRGQHVESLVDRLKLINQVSFIGCSFDVDVQDVF